MLRRLLPVILIGSGIFWVTMALVLPLVVYPKVAVLPLDPQAGQVAHGEHFNVFLPRSVADGGIQTLRDVGVTSNVFVSADPTGGPRPADSPNAVWRVATETNVDGHGLLETTVEVVSLDRHTARASNCCGDALITEAGDLVGTPMKHRGYVFNFPFNVQKHNYPVWDASINDTRPAVYSGTGTKRGLKVYRFEQNVDDIKTGTQDLPGSLYGLKAAVVTADYMYRTHRTYWIEPNSGGIVDYREAMDRRFVYRGKAIPVIQGTLNLVPPAASDPTFKLIKFAAFGLPLLRHTIPLVFGPIGVLLIVVGFLLHRRRLREEELDGEFDDWDDAEPADEEPADGSDDSDDSDRSEDDEDREAAPVGRGRLTWS